ncbi:MFS transporter [Gorillibacterium timonense]|uniref:MFS transporter n=1 Tax=Gorillibacterium timonense TaxID=1689269 RepID=UPI00071C336B|nr:MFS transporter [Gorillibacterium timonense]
MKAASEWEEEKKSLKQGNKPVQTEERAEEEQELQAETGSAEKETPAAEVDGPAQPAKQTLRMLLRNRGYVTLMLAAVISRFGDSLDSIAYSWMVYELTGSKALMGILFGINALPNLLFGPFAGVLVDRWPNKPILVITDLIRGASVCTTALLFFTGNLAAWHLFVLTIVQSTMETLCTPAENTLIPDLVPKKLLLSANSYLSTVSRLAVLGGLGAAGVLIALLGISGAILVDGFTFLFSALILLIGLKKLPKKTNADDKLTPSGYLLMIRESFGLIRRNRLLLATVITAAFVNFCLVPYNVLIPAFSKDLLHSGPAGLSYLGGAITIGMIGGGIWVGARGSRMAQSTLIAIGLGLIGAMYALISLSPLLPHPAGLISAVAFCLIIGLALPLAASPLMTILQEKTPREMMGRVMALMSMLACSAMPLGGWFTAALSGLMPMTTLFLVMGILVMFAAAAYRRSTRAL